jgi:hypothetical protein
VFCEAAFLRCRRQLARRDRVLGKKGRRAESHRGRLCNLVCCRQKRELQRKVCHPMTEDVASTSAKAMPAGPGAISGYNRTLCEVLTAMQSAANQQQILLTVVPARRRKHARRGAIFTSSVQSLARSEPAVDSQLCIGIRRS